MPEQIERLDGEDMMWSLMNGYRVFMMSGIKDRARAMSICDWFTAFGNCEASLGSLDNGHIVKITFNKK